MASQTQRFRELIGADEILILTGAVAQREASHGPAR
jgi:hypothetical protein